MTPVAPRPIGARGWTALVVAGLAWLLLAACDLGDEPEEGPDEPEALDAPDTGEVADDELAAAFDEIVEQVAELRGLEPDGELPVQVVTSEELVEVALESGEDDLERFDQTQSILEALHHLPAGSDPRELSEQLIEAGAVGLYVPETGQSYVVGDDGGLTPMRRVIVAHEVVHALQDQAFGLERMEELRDQPDAAMAFSSVVEGDAVLSQERWASHHLDEEEQQQRRQEEMSQAAEQMGVLQELPPALVESFLAPYSLGPRFVQAIVDAEGSGALDEALTDPPTTMVEILDPDLYLEGFVAEEVEVGPGPDGWDEVERLEAGAFDVLLLMELSDDHSPSLEAPSAWRGGQLAAWGRGDEVTVSVAWTFGMEEAADEVCELVGAWHATVAESEPTDADRVRHGPHDALAVDCDGPVVRFAVAPGPEVARAAIDR